MKKGWQMRNLGDLCRIRTGKKDVNQGNPDGDFPFFTCAAEHTFSDSYSFDTEALLIAGNGDVGKVSYYNGKFEAYQRTYVLSDFTEVSPRFLFLILDGKLRDTVSKQKLGNTMPYIKVGMLTDFQLPVPPLPEQHRIVSILDEAFAGLATAKATAEKNLHNARALFESHLQSVFSHRGKGWVEKPLENVASILNGFSFKSTDFSSKAGTKCIKITNVGVRDFVCNSDGYLPAKFAAQYQKVAVREGSIVMALTRTIIAGGLKVAVVPDEYDGALLNQRVASIQAHDKDLNGAFLFAYLSTQTVVDYVKGRVNTLMQPNLSIMDLRSMPIPAPPRREQDKITEQLDAIRDETHRLAAIYQQKLAALEALKKSLLHQAFSGEL